MSNYIAATTMQDSANHRIIFNSEGYYMAGDSNWEDITFTASMIYDNGTIGIAPRVYEDNMYMTFSVANKVGDDGTATEAIAKLDAQVTYTEIHLATTSISPLVKGAVYTIKAVITGTNYKIYLNDTLVFNIEYSSMARGKVGIYATAGNACTSIQVDSIFPDAWKIDASTKPGGIGNVRELENDDKYLYLYNPTASNMNGWQDINIVGGRPYTVSFNYMGTGTFRFIERNGAAPQTYTYALNNPADFKSYMTTRTFSSDCTRVGVLFTVINGQELSVNSVQLEQSAVATSYIHNDSATITYSRENSVITFPSKNNINQEQGTVSIWVKPIIDHAVAGIVPTLFEYGDDNGVIRLSYANGDFRLTYGTTAMVSYTAAFTPNTWYHIVGQWNGSKLNLYVNNVLRSASGNYALSGSSDVIHIGGSYRIGPYQFNGVVDETIVYKDVISAEDVAMLYNTTEQIPDNTSMVLRATFNYAVGNFNRNFVEATPAPQYGSPVILEKEDGTPLNKVSFFDYETGEYRTWNEEQIVYDGESDYLVVSYEDIDKENFEITIKDVSGVLYGENYNVDGYRIYHNFTDDERNELAGQTVLVAYQVNDAYTVDFNIGVPDSFRVNIGKHSGDPITIYYEGNDFQTEKLATMIELNPLLNPNHEGFLYITNNIEKVTSFKAKASMDYLPANGVTETIIVVEPMDMYGNFISHLQLDVTATKGTIIPAYDRDAILIRERAGRYLYKYTAPKIMFTDSGLLEEQDQINIIDKETGLGTQLSISLVTLQNLKHVIQKGETTIMIVDRYGVEVEDIMSANRSDTITNYIELGNYIYNNPGESLIIPINYSATLMAKTKEEIAEEPMIGYLVNKLCQYMDQKTDDLPSGLGAILDFNSDGLVSIDEVQWINDNKLTGTILPKYSALKAWEKINVG